MKIAAIPIYLNSNYKYNNINSSKFSTALNLHNMNKSDSVCFSGDIDKDKKRRLLKANGIIHSAASGAAFAAFAMAQTPGADTATLTAITTGMAIGLCRIYNVSGSSTLGTSIATIAVGKQFGVDLAMKCCSWIPGVGNAANAVSTFMLHEATGWSIVGLLEAQRKLGAIDENQKITKKILEKKKKNGNNLKDSLNDSDTPDSPTFTGKINNNPKEKQAKTIIFEYANKINLENKENTNIPQKLKEELCNLYNIDQSSQTAKQIETIFHKSTQQIKNIELVFDNDISEHIFDLSYITPFLTLTKLIENEKANKKDLNTLNITQQSLINSASKITDLLLK